MVTWGANQVFNIGNNAGAASTPAFGSSPSPLAPPAFGAPPPAPPGLFGSPAPAPPGGSLFGKPASGGLFGSTPAPAGGGLFGSTPAAAPLFGAPAPGGSSLFGAAPSPGGSLFGGGAPAPPPGPPAIPAQAALQAHMDASARQEAAKLQSSLEELHHAYSGTSIQKPSPLVTIVYNTMTSQQLQWQFAHAQSSGGGYAIPPKPPQVSEQTWLEAVVNNPDRSALIPVALIGAEALQARVGWQQQQATQFADSVSTTLTGAHESLQQRMSSSKVAMKELAQMHANLSSRLLRLMHKVEVVRCMNVPLQTDELALARRLQGLMQHLDALTKVMGSLQTAAGSSHNTSLTGIHVPEKQRLQQLFTEHRQSIVYLSETVQKEKRDVQLLKERLAAR